MYNVVTTLSSPVSHVDVSRPFGDDGATELVCSDNFPLPKVSAFLTTFSLSIIVRAKFFTENFH